MGKNYNYKLAKCILQTNSELDKYYYNLFRRSNMAKINESIIVVKVSELVKDSDEARPPLDAETIKQLEAVIAELTGGRAMVEIEMHNG